MAVNHLSSSLDVALSLFLRFLLVLLLELVGFEEEFLFLDDGALEVSSAIIKSPVESSSTGKSFGLFCFCFFDFLGVD